MHPVLFDVGSITIYSYGFFIAIGAALGGLFMWWQGKRRYGMTYDQANQLFVLLIIAGIVGGKIFLVFEDPSFYFSDPYELFSKKWLWCFTGHCFTAIPIMLLVF